MSPNVGPSDADRYGWRGVGEAALSTATARTARLIARTGAHLIGFLPVEGGPGLAERLAPLLFRMAEALLGFVAGDVAVVDTWRTWPWGEVAQVGDAATHRIRELRPRVLEIAPPPCGDPAAAGTALESALASRPATIGHVLVNLGGYAELGTVPVGTNLVDCVVLTVAARRTRQAAVKSLVRRLPAGKLSGALIIG